MTNLLLKMFAYLPRTAIDWINFAYNRIFYAKQTQENIDLWERHKNKLPPELSGPFKFLAIYEKSPDRFRDYIEGYTSEDFHLVKGDLGPIKKNNQLVMMCAVKDDLFRIQYQLKKMKEYGVKNFVYIDNGSTDGTKEWLAERGDVVLYSTSQRFNSTIKSSWYRRIVDSIGYSRWYLYLDSDEVYLYPGIEKDKFKSFLSLLEAKNMITVNSVLLDMYPKYTVNVGETTETTDLDEYDHFDALYSIRRNRTCNVFYGGPRYRLFGSGDHGSNWLNKMNLVFYQKDIFQYAHHLVPYSHNLKAKVLAATAHYKFLPNDFERFARIANAGSYAGNSREYRKYIAALEGTKTVTFYFKDSVHLIDSHALTEINILNRKLIDQMTHG